jgi:hypothetical protein
MKLRQRMLDSLCAAPVELLLQVTVLCLLYMHARNARGKAFQRVEYHGHFARLPVSRNDNVERLQSERTNIAAMQESSKQTLSMQKITRMYCQKLDSDVRMG